MWFYIRIPCGINNGRILKIIILLLMVKLREEKFNNFEADI